MRRGTNNRSSRPGAFAAITGIAAFQVGIMLVNLVRVKVLALELGTRGVGVQSIIEQIIAVVALVCTFSLPFASIKFLSLAHSRDRVAFARAYIGFRRALLVLSAAGTTVALTLVLGLPDLFGKDIGQRRDALAIGLLMVPVVNVGLLVSSALAAAQRTRASATMSLLQMSAVAALACGGLFADGLSGYFAGFGLGTLIAVLGGIRYLRAHEPTSEHGPVQVVRELRSHPGILRFAALQSVLTITTPVTFLLARYTVLDTRGLAAVGLMAAAFQIAQGLSSLLNPANAIFLTPAMNRDDPPVDKLERAMRFRSALIVIVSMVSLPLVLFPDLFLSVLFAPSFTDASGYLYIFVVSEALLLVAAVNQALLIGLDDFGVNMLIVITGQVVMIVLLLALVPALGVAGAGLALTVAPVVVLALTGIRLRRRHGMATLPRFGRFPPVALAMLAGAGAVGAGAPPDGAVVAAKALALPALVGGAAWYAIRDRGGVAGLRSWLAEMAGYWRP